MHFDIYNPHVNKEVTQDYVNVIEQALLKSGHTVSHVDSIKKSADNRKKGIVTIQANTSCQARKFGYKHIIQWRQGAGEAESFMRHHSWLRYYVIAYRIKYALKFSDIILFCSNAMKTYYEKLLHSKYPNSYIMPCFNDEINKDAFYTENKYKDNVFVYAGSLAVWQCFEQTVALYREVEKRVDNCSFRVLVADHEKATEILKKYGVERYSLGFVPKEEVPNEMAKAKFGFCIREDSVINRVATPTKLSSYVASGVIPVYSEYCEDFHSIAKNCKYCVCANPGDFSSPVDKLVQMCSVSVSPDDVFNTFCSIFGDYYSREYHINRLSQEIKDFLN